MSEKKKLGELLLSVGLITIDQLNEALEEKKHSNLRLGEILVMKKFVTERQILEGLEYQLGIPYVMLDAVAIQEEATRVIPEHMAKLHNIMPIKVTSKSLTIAMADPLDLVAMDDIQLITKLEILQQLSTEGEIQAAIRKHYGSQKTNEAFEEFKDEYKEAEEVPEDTLGMTEEDLKNVESAPVVKLVNGIFAKAVKARASDIHIEAFEKVVRVRIRIDGSLTEIMSHPVKAHPAMVARIKIISGLDVAERRIPQDGRSQIKVNDSVIDMRVSTLPMAFGEKVVIRLIDRNNFMVTKEKLGFTPNNLIRFDSLLNNPNGIVLVTGPTGSGKSTTLYTALAEINTIDVNLSTVEDPIEYRLEGVNQTPVNVKSGMTFPAALRSLLRQDPDIIMIGEIRDSETAQIAIKAAITGHLVLSTLHTNDAPSTISRLIDMGIPGYLVATAVKGIVAQRLVKKICQYCKEEVEPTESDIEALGVTVDKLYRGKGCPRCQDKGYSGRIAIHEVLIVTRELTKLITANATTDELRVQARKDGTASLKDACVDLVTRGITTVAELEKVTYGME